MARYVKAAPLSLDLTAALSFNQKFEFGASYRANEGIKKYRSPTLQCVGLFLA